MSNSWNGLQYTGVNQYPLTPPPAYLAQGQPAPPATDLPPGPGIDTYSARQSQAQQIAAQGQQGQPAPASSSTPQPSTGGGSGGGGGGRSFGEGFVNGANVGRFWDPGIEVAAGVVGGLGNVLGLGGKNASAASTPDANLPIDQRLAQFAQAQGLDPKQYLSSFQLQKQAASITGDKFDENATAKSIVKQIVNDAGTAQTSAANGTTVSPEAQLQAAQQQRVSDQNFTLALQSQAAQYFQPFMNNILQGGQAQAQALHGLAAQAPPSFRGIYDQQAALAQANAQSLAGAYAAQAMPPGSTLYRQVQLQTLAYQQAQQDIAYKQAQANQANARAQYFLAGGPGANSTSTSIDDLVAQQDASQTK